MKIFKVEKTKFETNNKIIMIKYSFTHNPNIVNEISDKQIFIKIRKILIIKKELKYSSKFFFSAY